MSSETLPHSWFGTSTEQGVPSHRPVNVSQENVREFEEFFASEVCFLQIIPILPPSILEDSRGIITGYLILSFQIGHSL